MKVSLVAYDGRELYKKHELKTLKYGYVRDCPKSPAIQIGSLEILGVNEIVFLRPSMTTPYLVFYNSFNFNQ
jgi:hypothetical protein